jgi:hypothetical protein
LASLLDAVQASALASYIRDSVVLYPVVNVAHVVAVMAFFAAVAAMDLGLLKVIRAASAGQIIGRLRPVAIAAFVVVAATGAMLFLPDAAKTAGNPAFVLKLVAIILALGNVALNEWTLRRHGEASRLVPVTAGLSLALWLSVAALGRAIAYV